MKVRWIACLLLLAGCKDEPTAADHAQRAVEEAKKAAEKAAETVKQDTPQNVEDAMKEATKAIGNISSNVEPVSYKKLKGLLPEQGGDFKRTKTSGEKAGAFGVKVSHANGVYEGPDGATATIKITDPGTMTGVTAGMAAWANVEIERESDDGYERTFEHDGHKALEKFETKRKAGKINAFVAGRFIIEVRGKNIEKMDGLKKLFEEIDVGDLADMKDEGVKDAKD